MNRLWVGQGFLVSQHHNKVPVSTAGAWESAEQLRNHTEPHSQLIRPAQECQADGVPGQAYAPGTPPPPPQSGGGAAKWEGLTSGGQERAKEFHCHERLRKTPEEFLQQAGHIVRVHVIS